MDTVENLARSFSKLSFQGQVNATIHLRAQHSRGGVLYVEDSIDLGDEGVKFVLHILCSKTPNATSAKPDVLMMGNANPMPVHLVVHNQITQPVLYGVWPFLLRCNKCFYLYEKENGTLQHTPLSTSRYPIHQHL